MKIKLRSWLMDGNKRRRPGDVIDVSDEDGAMLIATTGAESVAESPASAAATPDPISAEPADPPAPSAQATASAAPQQQQSTKGGQKR